MSIDDSIPGLREYCERVHFPMERFGEVRTVYNKTYSFHMSEHAVPHSMHPIEYQIRSHELIVEAQARAASLARDYIRKELQRKVRA